MSDNIARWRQDHRNFGKLLDFLQEQLDLFHAGDDTGKRLLQHLDGIVNGDVVVARQTVDASGRAYTDTLRQHMTLEETRLFGPAVALPDTTWVVIAAALPHRDDPLFGKTVEGHYNALCRQVRRDAAIEPELHRG